MTPVTKDQTFTALMIKNNELLGDICDYKKTQQKNDIDFRQKWEDEKERGKKIKRRSSIVTAVQVGIGLIMLYLGVLEFNQTNPIVIDFNAIMSDIIGCLTW